MVFGKRLMALLRALFTTDPEAIETEPKRSQLKQRLLAEGFLNDEVDAVFEWFAVPALREEVLSQFDPSFLENGLPDDDDQLVSTISREAMTFLEALRELDLVDGPIEEDIMNRLVVMHVGEVTLEDMKRVAAMVMFEHQFGSKNDYNVFDEEWRLLFN